MSWGESHFSLFSGRIVTFRGYGEYTLAKFDNFEVQIRQAPSWSNATSIFAVCLNIAPKKDFLSSTNPSPLPLLLLSLFVCTYKYGQVAIGAGGTIVNFLLRDNVLNTYVNGSPQALPAPISSNISISNSTTYQISVILQHALVMIENYGGTLGVSIWLDTNGTSALITPRAGLCGAEQNQSFSIPSDIDPNTYDQLGISRHLLFSSPPDTNHLIAHVDATTSMFNYTLTNSSYSTHNQLFSPNYNHTISPSLFYVASQYCMAFTSGPLYDSCAFLLPPATPLLFQRACLEDVAASDSLIRAEPSIIAYSQLCQLSNASLGNLVFLLPLFFVLLIPFTFYYFILLTLPKLVTPIVALHSTAYGSAAGLKRVIAGRPIWIAIQPVDALNNPLSSSSLPLSPFVISIAGASELAPSILPARSSYNLSFVLRVPGEYSISILLNDSIPLPSSPLSLTIISGITIFTSFHLPPTPPLLFLYSFMYFSYSMNRVWSG